MRRPPYWVRGVTLGIPDIVVAADRDRCCVDALATASTIDNLPPGAPAALNVRFRGATKACSAVFRTIYPDLEGFIWTDCQLMRCGMAVPHTCNGLQSRH